MSSHNPWLNSSKTSEASQRQSEWTQEACEFHLLFHLIKYLVRQVVLKLRQLHQFLRHLFDQFQQHPKLKVRQVQRNFSTVSDRTGSASWEKPFG